MRESFVFYRTFKDTIDNIPDKDLQLLVYKAITDYGITGDYDKSNPMVVAFMQKIIFQIDRAQNHYDKTVGNGGKGGAKTKYDRDEIRGLYIQGKDKNDIAKMLGCSVRTVERATIDLR